jgi:hypothetical protein
VEVSTRVPEPSPTPLRDARRTADTSIDGLSVAQLSDAVQDDQHAVRPVWPSRTGESLMMSHLDLEVDDLEQATAYAVEVRVRVASCQPQEDMRVVLDPASHPFCLCVDSEDPGST